VPPCLRSRHSGWGAAARVKQWLGVVVWRRCSSGPFGATAAGMPPLLGEASSVVVVIGGGWHFQGGAVFVPPCLRGRHNGLRSAARVKQWLGVVVWRRCFFAPAGPRRQECRRFLVRLRGFHSRSVIICGCAAAGKPVVSLSSCNSLGRDCALKTDNDHGREQE